MDSQRKSRSKPRRRVVRYTYTVEEESFSTDGSDSDLAPKKSPSYDSDSDPPPVKPRKSKHASSKHSHTKREHSHSKREHSHSKRDHSHSKRDHSHPKREPLKNTDNTFNDSSSSQESLTTDLQRQHHSHKPPKKSKKIILEEVVEASKSQRIAEFREDADGSDSSLIFTDEISEASSLLKDHPSLSKSFLLKKHAADSGKKEIKPKTHKRKDLSASRKACSKKFKPNESDDVEFIPAPIDCITIESDNFSEVDISVPTCSSRIKAEKNLSPVKAADKIREEDQDVRRKKKKRTESTKELPSSTQNTQMKYEPEPLDIEFEDEIKPLMFVDVKPPFTSSSSNIRIKPEAVDTSSETEDRKSHCKKRSKQTPTVQNFNVKNEPEHDEETEKEDDEELNDKRKLKPKSASQNVHVKVEKEKKPEIPVQQNKPDDSFQASQSSQQFQAKLGSPEWESQMVAELMELDFYVARNVVNLFENDCTIPFIARYRREVTNNMDADLLRQVKSAYDYTKLLEKKAISVIKKLETAGKLTPSLESSIRHVKSTDELDFIFAPYKQSSAKSKAEKARSLGLEEAACNVLNGNGDFNPHHYVNGEKDGIKNSEEVIQSVQHIMAEMYSKDEAVLEFIYNNEYLIPITVKSTLKKGEESNDEGGKFRLYYDFARRVRDLQSHQILALNRGESLKILSVKLLVDDSFYDSLYMFCRDRWLGYGKNYSLRKKMFDDSFKDSYTRLISPLLTRRTKAKLTRKAQETAIENFALNLKSLLQTPPVRGCPILGIDPGLRHGVKFALISNQGDVLWTSVLNFDLKEADSEKNFHNMITIKRKMVQYRCELIAIGNGCGSREIETVISNHLKNEFFSPELNVSYTFVNERGASIYSCSPIAKEEFPDLDPNLISAVFIARSLQDPLSEFVKVEPKHLGVGMYQHDMPEVKLNQSLDEVVMQVVSFTGIDLNTASIHLLKRVAGLGAIRAANILKWRQDNGPFKNRQQLTQVKMIGPKTFEQSSGFLRIHPQTCNVQSYNVKKTGIPGGDEYNPLDSTWIHPESYNIAYLFIGQCDCNASDLGTPRFIDKIKRVVHLKGLKSIAHTLGQSEQTISFIYDALIKPSNYDYRFEFSKPVFNKGLRSMETIQVNDVMQGVVTNVVAFGAFVDVGIGKSGLIHISNMNRIRVQVGDRVEVKILSIEISTGRISLYLMSKN